MKLLFILILLCLLGERGWTQGNLLPQGSFENPSANTEWAHATGVFEIADLTVTPHLVTTTTRGDAVLPAGMSLNWDRIRVEAVNRKRAQVSLDGIWRFIPAPEGTVAPPQVGWAYIKVPGDW